MKQLAIFDLDGTLLNTIKDLGEAVNFALDKNGFHTHSIASYPFFVGNGVRRLIERSLPEDARKQSTVVETMLRDFKQYYNEHNTDRTQPYDGMPELLHQLQEQGVKLAVASNKYQQATEKIIGHFFADIDWVAVVGQQEGVPVKPDPSIIFMILSQAKVAKQDTLYVGDSGIDMEAARRACVDSVGVTWGFRPVKELKENHANVIINKPIDILPIIENGIPL
ncbi:MAG: HAD family hydrolase [Muribaculaceae bacterium]|nr:HAD family hydrolase [Muribaculaceae bacterium]MBQ3909912.1 HAD family hydrolase [Muribaculaceae bacterium]